MATKEPMANPLDKVLSDIEKVELQKFVDSPIMAMAVRKVLLFGVYSNGVIKPDEDPEPTMNFALQDVYSQLGVAMTNEKLGENLRAKGEAILMLEGGFDKLNEYKTPKALKGKEAGGHR